MPTLQTPAFLDDLERAARARQQMASQLEAIALLLQQSELSHDSSGQMGLEREIDDLHCASRNLEQGVFRLLVLGDMKRGKSTLLNALLGENLLPSDVNPCTALLTILRYGPEKKVTVHFNDNRPPQTIDFQAFKQQYTINPEEAKRLEQQQELAFPEVSHAVVEYPLPLLERRIEIVDSPGLNDTEARNELSLGFLGNCHAVLFVLRASQPCTLSERRYLENYVKGRGLSVFFLINAWDQVRESLIDPEDSAELAEAETRLRQVFRANLAEYCQVDGFDLYPERVFELSAIQALRRRIKDTDADLEGTGFPSFLAALNTFLTQERAIAELRQGRTLARQARQQIHEAVQRRLPLLEQDALELKTRIASVEPEFKRLGELRDDFRGEIRQMRDRYARSIADSFRRYILQLELTFEQDFFRYQPADLGLLDILNRGRQEEFTRALERAFQQYMKDKFFTWSASAERELGEAFSQLARSAERYGASYREVTQQINEKLTGHEFSSARLYADDNNGPGWAKWAMGLFSVVTGNWAGAALALAGFNFESLMFNVFTAAGVSIVTAAVFGIALGPIAFALVSLGIGAMQADQARKKLTEALKKELVKYFPTLAQEQWQSVYTTVQESFNTYEQEVTARIDDDIKARQAELDGLLRQKESYEVNQKVEADRLRSLEARVDDACEGVERVYRQILV